MTNRKDRASTTPNEAENTPAEIVEAVQDGDLTGEEAAEELQEAARRRVAEEGPAQDTDEDGTITLGGFGSGQGMTSG